MPGFLTDFGNARHTRGNSRVPCQDLMAALVGDHRVEAEVLRVGVAFKGLGEDRQQILACRAASTVLGTARLAVDMARCDR